MPQIVLFRNWLCGKLRNSIRPEYSAHFLHLSASLYGKWKKCVPGIFVVLFLQSRNVQRQPPIILSLNSANWLLNMKLLRGKLRTTHDYRTTIKTPNYSVYTFIRNKQRLKRRRSKSTQPKATNDPQLSSFVHRDCVHSLPLGPIELNDLLMKFHFLHFIQPPTFLRLKRILELFSLIN